MPAIARDEPVRVEKESYEQLLSRDLEWALGEGSLFFEKKGAVQQTLKDIATQLERIGVPYAVCGGMALFAHGYRRFTEDVDILVTREGCLKIHAELVGRGYLPPFETSKNLRNTDTKVKVEFLLSGGYPGDGQPKPVVFPDPGTADVMVQDGIRYLGLATLIELKLASGLSAPHRAKDLVDVSELISALSLPREFSSKLHPSVAEGYLRQWDAVRQGRRFVRYWATPPGTGAIVTFQDLLAADPNAEGTLRQMEADGVQVERVDEGTKSVRLVTTDAAVALRWDMHDEQDVLKP